MGPASRGWLIVLALGLCLANCWKPLAVDDTVYYEYARHIAAHPLDPYGFTLGPGAEPANEVLAPAGFLYYWGAVYRVTGEWPLGWKLSLAPLCLLFVFSLADLARRFAPGLEGTLVALTVLSPAFLPGLNLMLDLPALTLSLAATALFLRACERDSLILALAAGLLTGLAMQTKYTAFVTPAVFLLASFLQRRIRLGLLAAGLAGLLFVAWETYLAARYGDSHFLVAMRQRSAPWTDKLQLAVPLVGLLGGTAAALALLNLAGLGASRRSGWLLVGLGLIGYLLVALVPDAVATLLPSDRPGRSTLNVNSLVFGSLGLVLLGTAGVGVWRLLREPDETGTQRLLVGWLLLEVAGYFALSPYPAVRRVMGVVVAGVLAGGALAARHVHPAETGRRDALLRLAVLASALTGLVGFLADFDLYRLEKAGAEQASAWIRGHQGEGGWYRGMGCFEFYAAGQGLRRLDVRGTTPRPGDWLVVPTRQRASAEIRPEDPAWRERGRLRLGSPLPFRSCYQWGGTALEHQEGAAFEVTFYQLQPTGPLVGTPR